MKRIVVATLVLMVLSGLPASGQGNPGRIEELLGLTVGADGVTFQVRTGGCTRPENFRIQRFEGASDQILLIRIVPDRCEALIPYGMTFTVPFGDLHVRDQETFQIMNPIAPVRVILFP